MNRFHGLALKWYPCHAILVWPIMGRAPMVAPVIGLACGFIGRIMTRKKLVDCNAKIVVVREVRIPVRRIMPRPYHAAEKPENS